MLVLASEIQYVTEPYSSSAVCKIEVTYAPASNWRSTLVDFWSSPVLGVACREAIASERLKEGSITRRYFRLVLFSCASTGSAHSPSLKSITLQTK
ncbi:hypothetical protein WJX75_006266 [Coccomyxa subellipsoidea]|uniref:Uncharacterized protein n=1 Tax=Coccomyxa subellipsoidea TaxID=248742 RepID=A0ABR2Z4J8_9CHLO